MTIHRVANFAVIAGVLSILGSTVTNWAWLGWFGAGLTVLGLVGGIADL